MNSKKIKSIITELEKLSPRKGKREKLAFDLLTEILQENDIDFEVQKFKNAIPNHKVKHNLEINFIPNTFSSGKIEEFVIISNLEKRENFSIPNINFNPLSNSISLATFYYVPSIAISKKDLNKLPENLKIKIKVKKEKFVSRNILVGNDENPKNIFFTHYDTVLNGANDNSSGVAILLYYILNNRDSLEQNLFVFCGSEELSFEKPYWCKGYREFEKEYFDLMNKANKIIIVDSIGHEKPKIERNKELLKEAFVINNFEKFYRKIYLVTSIQGFFDKKYFSIYHSYEDAIDKLNENYLLKSLKIIRKFC